MATRLLSVLIILLSLSFFAYGQESGDADNQQDGLHIGGLAAVDDSAIGTLIRRTGGFPADIWQSLTAEEAIVAVGNLPVRYGRTELLRLGRALLLTAAPLNRGALSEENYFEATRDFMLLRIRKLYNMGLYEDAFALLDSLPGRYFGDAFERLGVNLQLEAGDYQNACLRVPQGQNLAPSENNFWHRLIFFCAMFDGRGDEAEFILNVMNEVQGFSENFTRLANQALGLLPQDDLSNGDSDTISFALRDYLMPPAFDAETDYDTASLYRLLRSPAVSDADKALIGLRLHRKAVITTDSLAGLYAKIPFYKSRANARFLTESDYSHVYQTLREADNPDDKAAIIKRFVNAGVIGEHLPSVIRQITPHIDFVASPDLKDSAKILSVIELYRGNSTAAASWNNIVKGNSQKPSLYDVLSLLVEPDSFAASIAEVQLQDLYGREQILNMPLASLLAADRLARENGQSLLDSATWQALRQRHGATGESIAGLSSQDALQAYGIEALLNEDAIAFAITEFLNAGDRLATADAYSYLHIWRDFGRLPDIPIPSQEVLLLYFLQNGFNLTDN